MLPALACVDWVGAPNKTIGAARAILRLGIFLISYIDSKVVVGDSLPPTEHTLRHLRWLFSGQRTQFTPPREFSLMPFFHILHQVARLGRSGCISHENSSTYDVRNTRLVMPEGPDVALYVSAPLSFKLMQ